MLDVFSAININPSDADKIQRSLEKIKSIQASSSDIEEVLNVASSEFNQFFSQYGKPYFTAHLLKTNDTARSSIYNENLSTLDDDLTRIYSLLKSSSSNTVNAFNYSTVISKEITNKADALSSKVLDLNILNGFTRGQVIIAGDNFTDNSKIDSSVGLDSTPASLNNGANVVSLQVVGATTVTGPNTTISITPVKPIGPDGKVNTEPTPLNLERFYEGKYYAHIGQQEPEGGTLNLKYVVDPSKIPSQASITEVNGNLAQGSLEELQGAFKTSNFYAVVPTSEDEKQSIRARMIDGNPDTYWQCEFVYAVEPLIDPQEINTTNLESNNG